MLFIPYDDEIRGKRITTASQPESGVLIDYGIVSNHIELDLINLSSSGLEWLDSPIAAGTAKPIIMQLNNYKSGSTFNLSARIKGHSENINSSSSHTLKYYIIILMVPKSVRLKIGLEIHLEPLFQMIKQ